MERKSFLYKTGAILAGIPLFSGGVLSREKVSASILDNATVEELNKRLSDNGKDFKFGYNTANDAYGYYKDGVFVGFGEGSSGGGSMGMNFQGVVFYNRSANRGGRIENNQFIDATSFEGVFEGSEIFRGNLVPGAEGRMGSRVVCLKDGFYIYEMYGNFTPPTHKVVGDEITPYLVGPYSGDVYGFTIMYLGETNPFETT